MRCRSFAQRAGAPLAAALAVFLTAPAAGAQWRAPAYDAYAEAPLQPGPGLAAQAGVQVLSRDLRRGAPTMLVGSPDVAPRPAGPWRAEARAADLLEALAPTYGLGPAALTSARVRLARETLGGAQLVVFEQRAHGLPVHGARLTMLLGAGGDLVGAGGALHAAVPDEAPAFALSEREAIAHALADQLGGGVVRGAVAPGTQRPDGYRDFALAPAGVAAGYALDGPVRSRPVLYPLPQRMVPAYYVELWLLDGQGSSELVATVVSA
ncbi:MAG: hypothetical protein AAGH15_18145, partial [Myxococcota bacterium]